MTILDRLTRIAGSTVIAALYLGLIVLPLEDSQNYVAIGLLVLGCPLIAWAYSLPRADFSSYALNGMAIAATVAVAVGIMAAEDDVDMGDSAAFIVGALLGAMVAAASLVAGAFVLLLAKLTVRG